MRLRRGHTGTDLCPLGAYILKDTQSHAGWHMDREGEEEGLSLCIIIWCLAVVMWRWWDLKEAGPIGGF